MRFSGWYIVGFSIALSVVCAILVSTSAVTLEERQERNRTLDRRQKVLEAAGLVETGAQITPERINELFERVQPVVIDLESGEPTDEVDPTTFDQQRAKKDPATSEPAPANNAGVNRVPDYALVFHVIDESTQDVEMIVLPIEGYGLWSTLYGYIALSADTRYVRGLTYYQHGETPGLGGEVDNKKWKSLWPGRKVFDQDWVPAIEVIKGAAGPVDEAPYKVDGLSGATITARGVTNMLHFWLGEKGFGPYLERFRQEYGGVAPGEPGDKTAGTSTTDPESHEGRAA